MAKKPTTFEVTCPCCSAVLKIDTQTQAVIAHTPAVKPKTFADMEAAAKGVHEGWKQGAPSAVNVNNATEGELRALPGISHQEARKIIDARPYRNKNELVSKGALSEDSYERIRDRITV